ncbi:TATA box-binding protein-associated factor RNA polymerase I subunit B-like [Haliotis rufescens]|uniref:TATA box-binding protein-associated factor RNA polymerase I subunit B-like n=1 Tax=Haliotis rufescens TaxID=6454 RepID=UPI00201ED841|nr:TATA box-binding protein-associated factor RNA polymerase I subunit B-like [Haliotis rufescens]XP_048258544.1 TATA box-binding protein-associated factor RNA polymerase I subunit B-like [Haliotis rufescens]
MPQCVVCGLEDFEERDGLFYCTTCQTQTQDLIVEEDEFEENVDTGQPIVDHRRRIKQAKVKVDKPEEYKGRPWTIYEAYQIILKHQVQAFIRKGAHPKLEEFVFRLWAVYLSKLKVAFSEDEHIYPEALRKHVRHREKYYGTLENPIVPAVRNIRMHKKRNPNRVVDAINPASVEGEEFYEGDDPTQVPDEVDRYPSSESEEDVEEMYPKSADKVREKDPDDLSDVSMFDDSFILKTKSSLNRMMALQMEWLNLPKLLSLCQLGLLYTNSITTAADIVRLVEAGEIPYTEVTTLLPEEFQYGSYDPQLFLAEIPKPHALRYLTGNMAHFLGIGNLPEVPVSQLISKYILMLDLPGEFHGLVMSVVSQHPPQCHFSPKAKGATAGLPFFDGLAMAYIILTLKLYFGIDDITEVKLSDYSREVKQLIQDKHELFVFEDWKNHLTEKRAECREHVSLFSHVDLTDVNNIDVLLESYYKSNQHRRRTPRYYMGKGNSKGDDYNRYQQRTKEDLAHPFKLVAEKMQKSSDIPQAEVCDGGEGHEDKERSISREGRKFICSSLKHITTPATFLDDLDRHGLSDDTIYSSCMESEDEEDYEGGGGDSDDSSLYSGTEPMSVDSFDNCPTQRPKKKKSAVKQAVRHVITKMELHEKLHIPHVKMAECMKKHISASENFVIFKKILLDDRKKPLELYRPKSFCWLLNICGEIVRCSPYEMDVFVIQLSYVYFSFKALRHNLPGRDIKRFREKYFAHEEEEDNDFVI